MVNLDYLHEISIFRYPEWLELQFHMPFENHHQRKNDFWIILISMLSLFSTLSFDLQPLAYLWPLIPSFSLCAHVVTLGLLGRVYSSFISTPLNSRPPCCRGFGSKCVYLPGHIRQLQLCPEEMVQHGSHYGWNFIASRMLVFISLLIKVD